jgi:hypothetical protein
LVVVSFFTACRTTKYVSEAREPNPTEHVTFKLAGDSLTSEFIIVKFSIEDNYREAASRPADEELFQLVKEYCKTLNILFNDKVYCFILYYNFPVSSLLAITDEDIKGVSVYQIEKRKIMHHLFVKNEYSEFYEIKNVNVAVPLIPCAQINLCLENYVFTDSENKNNKSNIAIFGKFSDDVEINRKKYIPFSSKLRWLFRMPMKLEVKRTKRASR